LEGQISSFRNKSKGLKQDRHHRLRSPMPEGGELHYLHKMFIISYYNQIITELPSCQITRMIFHYFVDNI
jgi:hypothetical protein